MAVFDFLVLSVFIVKFLIEGTVIELYSAWVSKKSGSCTLRAIVFSHSFSPPSLSLLSDESEVELLLS